MGRVYLAHDDLLALKPYMKGHFDHAMDPVKVPQLAAAMNQRHIKLNLLAIERVNADNPVVELVGVGHAARE